MSAKIEIEPSSLATVEQEEGRDDREAADEKGQCRRDEAPEEEQRKQEQDRERQELCALKVGLDVLVDLLLGDRVPADEDVVLVLELGDQRFARVLEGVVLGGLELDGEVGGLAVLRDERIGLRLEEVRDAPRTPSTSVTCSRDLGQPARPPSGVVGSASWMRTIACASR